jgi:hypothetical protein
LAGALDPAGLMSLDELAEYHENCYYGEHDTDTAFAEHYADEVGDTASVPEHMRNYIDYEYYARELLYDFMSEAGHIGGTHERDHRRTTQRSSMSRSNDYPAIYLGQPRTTQPQQPPNKPQQKRINQ